MQKNKEDIRQVSKISHYREVKNASRPFYHLLQSLFCDLYRIFLIVNTITSLLPHSTPPFPFPASSSGSAPAYSTALHTAKIDILFGCRILRNVLSLHNSSSNC